MPTQSHDSTPPDGDWSITATDDPFQVLTGPVFAAGAFDAEPGELIRIGFRVGPDHCNSGGPCHGGMIVTFLDLALGLTAKAAAGANGAPATMTLTTDFLQPALLGDWIESRVRLVHRSPGTAFCDGVAVGPRGPIGRANGLFKLPRPPSAG